MQLAGGLCNGSGFQRTQRRGRVEVAKDFHFAVSQADTHARAGEMHVFPARTSMKVDERSLDVDWSDPRRQNMRDHNSVWIHNEGFG